MDPMFSPFSGFTTIGRDRLFLEARQLVNDQFPEAPDEAKMALIGNLVIAFATLFSADRIANEISGSLADVGLAIREVGSD